MGSPRDDRDLPTDPAEIERLQEELEAWLLENITEPLGLADAVNQDRGEWPPCS